MSKSYQLQQRHILVVMLFFATIIAMLERIVLNMAITCMVYLPNSIANNQSASEAVCLAPDWISADKMTDLVDNDQDQLDTGVKYSWTQNEQGIILSSFYIGYALTHIPGGQLAQNYSSKYVLGLGITISALLSMIVPWAIQIGGSIALIAIRIVMGACQGPMFPAITQMLSMWIPPAERSFLISFVYSGVAFGIVFASYFSGIIIHYFSWQLAFLLFGSFAVIWFILFTITCYESPASHPFIKTGEKEYILQELGQLERSKDQRATPWTEILTSKPVIAFILAMMFSDWSYFVVSTTLPKYMNDVLRFSIRDIGLFNSIPWILGNMISYIYGYLIDKLIGAKKISITNARKFSVFLASILPAIFILAATYAGCEHMLVVIYFTLSIATHAFIPSGLFTIPMDLSANYSGTIMSAGNAAGAVTGFLAPYTVGLLTPNAYLSEWRLVFWMTFIFHIFKVIVFTIWASAKVQPWNDRQRDAEQANSKEVIKTNEK